MLSAFADVMEYHYIVYSLVFTQFWATSKQKNEQRVIILRSKMLVVQCIDCLSCLSAAESISSHFSTLLKRIKTEINKKTCLKFPETETEYNFQPYRKMKYLPHIFWQENNIQLWFSPVLQDFCMHNFLKEFFEKVGHKLKQSNEQIEKKCKS